MRCSEEDFAAAVSLVRQTVCVLIIFWLQSFGLFKYNFLQPNWNLNSPKIVVVIIHTILNRDNEFFFLICYFV